MTARWLPWLGVLGCAAPAPAPPVMLVDLTGSVATGVVDRSEIAVDVGTPAARRLMGGAWHGDEEGKDGATFAWASDAPTRITVELAGAEPLIVTARLRSYRRDDRPEQRLTVRLGDTVVADAALLDTWHELTFDLPADAVVAGANVLSFEYAWAGVPGQDKGTGDTRRLAAAWDRLTIRTTRAPVPAVADHTVTMPLGAGVRFPLHVPAHARLAWDALTVPDGGVLRVGLLDPGSGSWTWLPLDPATTGLPLSEDVGLGWVGVHIEATGVATTGGLPPLGEARWVAPRVEVPAGSPPPAALRRPNVIVYLVDTLRSDHLGCYGYDRATSPHVDALAADGVLYEDTLAQSPWTRSSVATALTGLYPRSHATFDRPDRLPDAVRLLPEMLHDVGYATAAIITNGNVSPKFGFDRGYDQFVYLNEGKTLQVHRSAKETHDTTLAWIDTVPADQPFFAYVHVSEPHGPYTPAPEFRARFAAGVPEGEIGTLPWLRRLHAREVPVTPELPGQLVDLYDGEIAELDAAFGVFVAELKRRDRYDDTLIVFTSDHGEEFAEHGDWEHGQSLYGEVLDIPLVIKPSRQSPMGSEARGVRSDQLGLLVDVVPTVLAEVGVRIPAQVEGVALDARPALTARRGFSHLSLQGNNAQAVVEGPWKYLRKWHGAGPADLELYDRESDPTEQVNRLTMSPERAAPLAEALTAHGEAHDARLTSTPVIVDGELADRLRALGYIE